MKRIVLCIISVLVSVFFAGVVSAADVQNLDTSTDKKKATSPVKKNVKSGPTKIDSASTEGRKKGDPAATTARQSKQQHDRAKQTIDNLK